MEHTFFPFREAYDCPFINSRQKMKKLYVTGAHTIMLKENKVFLFKESYICLF